MCPVSKPVIYRARYLMPILAPPIEDGVLLVENGLIRVVGSLREVTKAHRGVAVVDCGDAVLLPPMVNAHTHLELSSFAAWAAAAGLPDAPQDFVDWILWLLRVRKSVSAEQLCDSLACGLKASLLAGTGAVGDILSTLGAAPIYRQSPLRGRVFAEVLGHDLTAITKRLAAIDDLVQAPPSEDLSWGLSPHAPYTLSSAAADLVFAFAAGKSLQSSSHLAESAEETAFLHNSSGAIAEKLYAVAKWHPALDQAPGCSPVRAFNRQGRLKTGDLVVHGVRVNPADIDLLKGAGCSVALCPRSNAALEVGKAPVAAYLKAGVPLALGTDSLASCASLSLWDELAFARSWFSGAASPREWLKIATYGGAQALGLQARMGQLSPNSEASFQLITLPALPALGELEEALCCSAACVKVTHLYLNARNVLPEH
jgi:cytosine/adenosine deaminase-related metal-dependent hydrolase